jgi:hypothetical protein
MKQEQGQDTKFDNHDYDSQYARLIIEKEYDDEHKLIMENQTISILKYIRDQQAHDDSITKGKIVRYMDDNEICSRLTTLKLIQRLLDHKILLNDKKRDNTYSRLIIKPHFNFKSIEIELLTHSIKGIQRHFLDFNDETREANTLLIDSLLATLDDFSKKEDKEIYRTRPRMESAPTKTRHKV